MNFKFFTKLVIFVFLVATFKQIQTTAVEFQTADQAILKMSLTDNIISEQNTLDIVISAESEENTANAEILQQLKIRPFVENAEIFVFDEENGGWISTTDLWSKMPKAAQNIKLKILGVNDREKVEIKFLVQNMQTGQVFETKPLEVWTNKGFLDYIDNISNGIMTRAFEIAKESEIKELAKSQQALDSSPIITQTTSNIATGFEFTKNYLYLYLGIFLLSGGAGFVLATKRNA